MFLALVLLLYRDLQMMQRMYQQYLALWNSITQDIHPKASLTASNHIDHVKLNLDDKFAPTTVKLATQLLKQGLDSKQDDLKSLVHIASASEIAGFGTMALPAYQNSSCDKNNDNSENSVSIRCRGRRHSRMASRADLYKVKAEELIAGAEVEQKISNCELILLI